MSSEHAAALAALAAKDRLRRLNPRAGVDFSSNDYLALAESEEMRLAIEAALGRGVPVGAGGSRLLRGNHPEHEALEEEAAAFFHSETALFFASGYMANFALFSTLPQRGDLVVYDALVHASAHDGMRNGRAERIAVRHNDVDAFEDAIAGWRKAGNRGRPWIAVESLYSMDGDTAPLADLAEVAKRFDAMLLIDEAHATGVFGPDGRGLGARLEGLPNVISLHTCGKALGAVGALVTAPRTLRDFIVNRGRPFVFATAPSPLMASAVRASLDLCRGRPERREHLAARVGRASRALSEHCGIRPSGSQIMPVVIGADADAVTLAQALQGHGFDIRPVRPPTVPEGTARLRIAVTLNVTDDDVERLARAVRTELDRLGLRPLS
ncbi:MAG: 8-amino-7-oxononanoate synthase [Hyphomicrobiaceae bacterium]